MLTARTYLNKKIFSSRKVEGGLLDPPAPPSLIIAGEKHPANLLEEWQQNIDDWTVIGFKVFTSFNIFGDAIKLERFYWFQIHTSAFLERPLKEIWYQNVSDHHKSGKSLYRKTCLKRRSDTLWPRHHEAKKMMFHVVFGDKMITLQLTK